MHLAHLPRPTTAKKQSGVPRARRWQHRIASMRGHASVLVGVLISVLVGEPVHADEMDFRELLAGAAPAAVGAPIIIYATRADCRFCRLLEQEVLKPLIRSGESASQFSLLPLPLDNPRSLVNFAGIEIAAGTLAARYQLQLTPTLVFVDSKGSELMPRLIGYQSGTYYEHYLEEAIRGANTARRR